MTETTVTPEPDAPGAPTPDRQAARKRGAYRVFGLLLVFMFVGILATAPGFAIQQIPLMTDSSTGELYLWMAHAFLLLPGCVLLGIGFADSLFPTLTRVASRLTAMNAREAGAATLALFAVTVAVARIGNALVLLGYPFTDDEYATQFGGRSLAAGHATVPMPRFMAAVPALFLHVHDGAIAAADFLGAQLAWAISELTYTGSLVWALGAAAAVCALAALVTRRLGRAWGAVAVLMFAFSPMALSLSLTTHAHVLSRGFVALALWLYVRASDRGGVRNWVFVGLAIGAAFCCRPPETAFLMLPFGAILVYEAVRGSREARLAVVGLALGLALPAAAFAAHNAAVTGKFWLPARFSPEMINASLYAPGMQIAPQNTADASLWLRFGGNMSFNMMELGVWALGPVGVVLAFLGVTVDRFTKLCAAGVLSVIGLALFHGNVGIHMVGPIHYSESVIPVIVLATHGLARGYRFAKAAGAAREVACAFVFAVVLGLGLCDAFNLVSIRRSQVAQSLVYSALEDGVPAGTKAVVLAPQFASVWGLDPNASFTGTWVFEWRRPQPDFGDRVLILSAAGNVPVDELKAAFPDRVFYRVKPGSRGALEPELEPIS